MLGLWGQILLGLSLRSIWSCYSFSKKRLKKYVLLQGHFKASIICSWGECAIALRILLATFLRHLVCNILIHDMVQYALYGSGYGCNWQTVASCPCWGRHWANLASVVVVSWWSTIIAQQTMGSLYHIMYARRQHFLSPIDYTSSNFNSNHAIFAKCEPAIN